MRAARHSFGEFLPASMGSAFLFAVAFVLVLPLGLAPTDEAHGLPFGALLLDPFVLTIMTLYAGLSGLIAWPLFYLFLRDCGRRRGVRFVCMFVLCWIVLLTPLSPPMGFPGSFVGLLIGLGALRSEVASDPAGSPTD